MPLPLLQTCSNIPLNDLYLAGGLFGNRNTYSFAASQQCNTPVSYDDEPNPPRLTPEAPVLFSDFTPELSSPRNLHYIQPDLNPILVSLSIDTAYRIAMFFS
jgi:hypothetical protein